MLLYPCHLRDSLYRRSTDDTCLGTRTFSLLTLHSSSILRNPSRYSRPPLWCRLCYALVYPGRRSVTPRLRLFRLLLVKVLTWVLPESPFCHDLPVRPSLARLPLCGGPRCPSLCSYSLLPRSSLVIVNNLRLTYGPRMMSTEVAYKTVN